MKLTFDKVFNGNCKIYWINKSLNKKIENKYIPGGIYLSMSQSLDNLVVGPNITKIEIVNWEPIAQFLYQEKLIKIENGKVTLLF